MLHNQQNGENKQSISSIEKYTGLYITGRNIKLKRPLWKSFLVPIQAEHDYSRFTLNMGTSRCMTFALPETWPREIHTHNHQKNVYVYSCAINTILPKLDMT